MDIHMLNEFLTQILQVIIAIDILGVIAWFVLGARRKASESVEETPVSAVEPVRAPTAWQKLTGKRQPIPATEPGIDQAFGQLRRVLDSYGNSLA